MKKHFYLEDILNICDHNHLSANEIYTQLKKKYKDLSKASIYRNIQQLVKEWKLNEIKIKNKKNSFYEKNIWTHIHFIDQNWNITDIDLSNQNININLPKWFQKNKIEITIYWNIEKN